MNPDHGNSPCEYSVTGQFFLGCLPGLGVLGGFSRASLVAQRLKRLPPMWETRVRSLGWEDPLEKEMATHSSTLAWRIPWRKEPGRLHSMGSQRVGHDWATSPYPYPNHLPVDFWSISTTVWFGSTFCLHFVYLTDGHLDFYFIINNAAMYICI